MNCDRIARAYRWLEYGAFGRTLERRRRALVARLPPVRRVLLLGEGDGRFLAWFVGQRAPESIDVVDVSARMLERARARLDRVGAPGRTRVAFHRSDVRATPLPGSGYDLVVTHFFLDCLTVVELEALVARVCAGAAPAFAWHVAEFGMPSGGRLARAHAAVWLWLLYRFFRLTTGLGTSRLPDHATVLARHGLALARREQERWGLVGSELWQRPTAADDRRVARAEGSRDEARTSPAGPAGAR